MESSADDKQPGDLELVEPVAEKRPSQEDEVFIQAAAATPPPAEIAPRPRARRRCQIVGVATTELVAAEDEEAKETGDRRPVMFVPRPAVPTLSRAQLQEIQAQDITIRGNPCISSRKLENQLKLLVSCGINFIGHQLTLIAVSFLHVCIINYYYYYYFFFTPRY